MIGLRFRTERKTPLAAAKQARDSRKPRLASMVATTLTCMLGCLIFLATQTVVPQVTRAPGTLVPTGNYHQIETMEGGIVQTVNVVDGQTVQAGQILVKLESPEMSEEVFLLRNKVEFLVSNIENARALHLVFAQNKEVTIAHAEQLSSQGLMSAASRVHAFATSQSAQNASMDQQMLTIAKMTDALLIAEARAVQKEKSFQRIIDLYKRGLKTQTQFQQEADAVDELKGEAAEADVRLSQAQKVLADAMTARHNERQAILTEAERELTEDEEELIQQRVMLRAIEERIERLRLIAPVGGVIQVVAFPNPGEIIAPGETLFELLPEREKLFAEVRIPGADIGHITLDQGVEVTLDTFDPRRFGKVEGDLVALSPVPILDEHTGASFFRASIELESMTVGAGAFQRPLQAGMTVVANMNTGEQSLMAYFLKPVRNSLELAFSER